MRLSLFRQLLSGLLVWLAIAGVAEAKSLRILIIGSSSALSSEAPFPAAPIQAQLQQILVNDPVLTGSIPANQITVEAQDTYQSQPFTTDGDTVTLASRSLMSWFYWEGNHASTLALLDQGWDYVVMIDEPTVASQFPEYDLEGVQAIAQEVEQHGSQPLLVMTWSSVGTPASTFGQMAYRVGNGTGVPVVPAGYAWSSLAPALTGSGTRPNTQGAYTTAAAIYSQIFNRGAATSTYVPGGMTQSACNSIASAALSTDQTQPGQINYTGTYIGATHFCSPFMNKRTWTETDFNSSTEWGIRDAFLGIATVSAGTTGTSPVVSYLNETMDSIINPTYQTFVTSGTYDFCQSRFDYYDNGTGLASPAHWNNYATFDYQDDDGNVSMVDGVDRVMFPQPLPEQETGAYEVQYEIANYGPADETFAPDRPLWARLQTAHPEISAQPDGHHMSELYNEGIAEMMLTLLSGRCSVGDQPADTTSTVWQQWYCRKTGYEIAWQYATLQSRVPGLEIIPAANVTSVSPGTSTTLTVRFLYPPISNVTVNVFVDNANAAIVGSQTLTFTPYNYNTLQTVTVTGLPGSLSADSFNVKFATSSSDSVFNGLSDSWPYTISRGSTQSVTVNNQGNTAVSMSRNTSLSLTPWTGGRSATLAGPSNGTVTWSGTIPVYTPNRDFYGTDSISYYWLSGSTLYEGSVTITVNPPAGSVSILSTVSPLVITGTSAELSLTGSSADGAATLNYQWTVTGSAPGSVTFSPGTQGLVNGSTAMTSTDSVTAIFSAPGTYNFLATLGDGSTQATAPFTVMVVSTTQIVISPGPALLQRGYPAVFSAYIGNQFGTLQSGTVPVAWSLSSNSLGSINPSSGLFSPNGVAGGPVIVTATGQGYAGTTNLSVVSGAFDGLAIAPSAAYSVRRLFGGYAGDALNVRRDSDNQTLNIGFTPTGDLDTASLLAFTGSANGYVTAWYDQSGNGLDAVQSSTSNQPIIVSAGALQTSQTRPTIRFNGIPSVNGSTIYDALYPGNGTGMGSVAYCASVFGGSNGFILGSTSTYYYHDGAPSNLFSSIASSSVLSGSVWVDGTYYSPNAAPYPASLSAVSILPSSTTNTSWNAIGQDRTYFQSSNVYSELLAWGTAPPSTATMSALLASQGSYFNLNVPAASVTPVSVAVAAAASPQIVAGVPATLSVTGQGANGAALTYTWVAAGNPPGPVTFSPGSSGTTTNITGTTSTNTTTATFTAPGTYPILVTVTDGTTTATSYTTVTVNMTYAQWAAYYLGGSTNPNVVGQNANPAGDGIPNLLKFALGLDPSKAEISPITLSMSGGRMVLNFTQQTGAADFTMIVGAASHPNTPYTPIAQSSNGGAWTGPAAVSESAAVNGVSQVAVTDIATTAPTRFLRVQVTSP